MGDRFSGFNMNRVLQTKPRRAKSRGRPKTKWLDQVTKDPKDWKRLTEEKEVRTL